MSGRVKALVRLSSEIYKARIAGFSPEQPSAALSGNIETAKALAPISYAASRKPNRQTTSWRLCRSRLIASRLRQSVSSGLSRDSIRSHCSLVESPTEFLRTVAVAYNPNTPYFSSSSRSHSRFLRNVFTLFRRYPHIPIYFFSPLIFSSNTRGLCIRYRKW